MTGYILAAAGIFTGDLLIKNKVEKTLKEGEDIPILGGRLLLRRFHNRGAMLNFGEKRSGLVAALSVVLALAVLVIFIISLGKKGNGLLRAGLTLLLGGAFSNTYDRLKRKYVVDYVSFQVKWKRFRGIVFNISDFCIMIGALLAAVSV